VSIIPRTSDIVSWRSTGNNRNVRVTESLADIGTAVLQGAATSTFLAVVVLLFSSSYVFATLAKQFALTVGLGVLHGLVLLPVLLSIWGPKAFSSSSSTVITTANSASASTPTTTTKEEENNDNNNIIRNKTASEERAPTIVGNNNLNSDTANNNNNRNYYSYVDDDDMSFEA